MSLAVNIFVPLLLLLHLASGAFGLDFLPPGQVMAKQEHDFICQSSDKKPIDTCYFEVPGFVGEIKSFETVINPRYAFAGEGLQKGECGLRLLPVYRNNTGQFKCRLILDDFSEQTVSIQVDVIYPVDHVSINSNSKSNNYEYKEKELMEINCTAEGNPQPKITLFIDGEKKSESQGSALVFKTAAKPEYHNKDFKCEAEQPQLNRKIADDRKLTVFFAPRLVGSNNVTVSDGKATIQVWSYPPTVERLDRLTRNGVDVNVKHTKLKDYTITEYSWPIENNVTDLKAEWSLEVSNRVETVVFNLKLVEASEEGSHCCLIAFIVVMVLELLLLGLATAGGVWFRKKFRPYFLIAARKFLYDHQRRNTSGHEELRIVDRVLYVLIMWLMPELDSNIVPSPEIEF